nr:MAG TPA: hypothetical protein [Caudoviricetes sp.]
MSRLKTNSINRRLLYCVIARNKYYQIIERVRYSRLLARL